MTTSVQSAPSSASASYSNVGDLTAVPSSLESARPQLADTALLSISPDISVMNDFAHDASDKVVDLFSPNHFQEHVLAERLWQIF